MTARITYVQSKGFRSLDGVYHGFCYDSSCLNIEWHIHPLDFTLVPPGFTPFGSPWFMDYDTDPTFLNDLAHFEFTRAALYGSIRNFLFHNRLPVTLFLVKKQDHIVRRFLIFSHIGYIVKHFDPIMVINNCYFGLSFEELRGYSFLFSCCTAPTLTLETTFKISNISYFFDILFFDVFNPGYFFEVAFRSGVSYFFNYTSTHCYKVYRASTTDWRTARVLSR